MNTYLAAFYSGDFVTARSVVDDDFKFEGPLTKAENKESFFASAGGLRGIVRGHRTVHQWIDGCDVMTIYDVDIESPIGCGTVRMSEWHTVRNGALVAGRVIFDSNELEALLSSTH